MPAVAENVAPLRRRTTAWLRTHAIEPDTVDDLVLAVSEALENCCDHAFTGADSVGTMTLTVRRTATGVEIVIRDDGHWLPARPGPSTRGRGLDMIHQLVTSVELDRTPHGTTVTMSHRVDAVA